MIITQNNNLAYGRGYVYRMQYHLVWCVKYRRGVLIDNVESCLLNVVRETADELGFHIDTVECMPDHIHLLISCTPQHYIPTIIKILKGNTARKLFIKYPELKTKLWDGHLWNPSYFVATVSDNTSAQIEEYINNQKTK